MSIPILVNQFCATLLDCVDHIFDPHSLLPAGLWASTDVALRPAIHYHSSHLLLYPADEAGLDVAWEGT